MAMSAATTCRATTCRAMKETTSFMAAMGRTVWPAGTVPINSNGGPYFDEMHGGAGDDQLFGGGFFDILHGDDGNDVLCGGEGKRLGLWR